MSMKATCRALALLLFLAPAAAFATKIPIPIEGATLNVSFQLQTQVLFNQNGTPDGQNPSTDIFVRRSRLLVNGDINQNFTYLLQIDNPNFGKYGNYGGRAIVQDAWIGWAPTGITGNNVVYIDAGILLVPISHHLLESTTNFVTADVHTDAFRFPGNAFPNLRETGVQVRGWALDKHIGWRGGVYEGGYSPLANARLTPKRYPQFSYFINIDLIGSEEGGWLYGAYKWGKDPILSIGHSTIYQSQALTNALGSLTDQRLHSLDVYLNYPMGDSELVVEVTGYRNSNGSASPNTGNGFDADVGYRFGPFAPYVSYSYFQADDCDAALVGTDATTCAAAIETANSRNIKAGVNFFFNKNLNHLNIEFQANHGLSAYGPANVTVATAGYVPLALDPATPGGPRRAYSTNLRNPAFWSVLLHWNVLF
jgi:hypothetical protein